MPVDTVADFAALLRHSHLLEPAQLEEIASRLSSCFAEPRALAGELLRRGWLTAFQINQLFNGRGDDLLLGSYVLLERLGAGGMGEVYKARNWKLGKFVAVKLIRPERLSDGDILRRFQHEVRAAAQLNHANVVHAYDCDEAGGKHFLVLEYVEGDDLARIVKKHGPLPVDQACDCIRQAALGLQHAFERGLVHRDIKPHNLLRTRDGVVKILDMGLARLSPTGTEDATASTVTEVGTVMGTLDYIAPEQALDAHAADTRADLYSLGCTFYFLLSGRVPFPGGSAAEKLLKHQLEQATPVEQLRPQTPAAVAAVVCRLMAKRPQDRYQTPAEAAAVLSNLDNLSAGPTSPAFPPDRRVEKPDIAAEAMADTSPGWSSIVTPAEHSEIISPSDQRRAPRRKRWKRIVLAASIGLLTLIGLLVFLPRNGEKPAPELHSFVAEQEPHKEKHAPTFEEWMRHVAALPADRQVKEVAAKLKVHNPDFDGTVHSTIKDGVVVGLEFHSHQVTHLRPLRALPQLQSLICNGSNEMKGKLADLSPLKGMPLTFLNCNFTRVADLSPLQGMPLKWLLCAFTSVTDLSPLRGMDLGTLNIGGNPGINDLSPLRGMSLHVLHCRRTRITDLSPLKDMPLTALLCPIPATKDHETLRSLKSLKQINGKPIAEFWKGVAATRSAP